MTVRHRRKPDGSHLVNIHALRVLLFQEGDHWIAQGLEVDYTAAGDSVNDVRMRFEQGLGLTIGAHLEKYDSLDRLLKPAPAEIWKMFYECNQDLDATTVPIQKPRRSGFRELAFLQAAAAP
jgi:hypothetical protein